MQYGDMRLLYQGRIQRRNVQGNIGQFGQATARLAPVNFDNVHSLRPGRFRGTQNIRRSATGAERDQLIALAPVREPPAAQTLPGIANNQTFSSRK